MRLREFTKMHGLGNDFLIFPWDEKLPKKTLIRALASRQEGIGCDLIVFLSKSNDNITNYRANFFNNDGSEAEICGNALRCIGKLHFEKDNSKNCLVETNAGLIDVEFNDDQSVSVDIGIPKFGWKEIPLIRDLNSYDLGFNFDYLQNGFALNVGNPHVIFVVKNLDQKKLLNDSKKIEKSNFFPSGVNINVVEIKTKKEISVITHERGVGITLACGTGACASVVAGHKLDLLEKKVDVKMPGGSITVEITTNNHILMTGSAKKVFEGKIDMDEFKDAE